MKNKEETYQIIIFVPFDKYFLFGVVKFCEKQFLQLQTSFFYILKLVVELALFLSLSDEITTFVLLHVMT